MATLLFSQAQAATITVNSDADASGTYPGATCTLRQAIATATKGDTITFSLPANSTINLTSGQLIISKNLTIPARTCRASPAKHLTLFSQG